MLDELLNNLFIVCAKKPSSRREIAQAMRDIFEWLVNNNTDENCKKVDAFVFTNLITQEYREKLSNDLYEILFDMGSALSDTHSAPEVAKNFDSTPEQLLERSKQIF